MDELRPYDGLSRYDRIRRITKSKEIDKRLFLLTQDPNLREKLHAFKNVMEGIMDKHPEIAGITLLGSYVHGYANNESGIDSYAFIDEDKLKPLRQSETSEDVPEKVKQARLNHYRRIRGDIDTVTGDAGLGDKQLGLRICDLSRENIKESCLNGTLKAGALDIHHLFHLGIGSGIYEYRELVISTLENMGDRGKRLWLDLIYKLFDNENKRFRKPLRNKRMMLYPRTLADARKHFLSHRPKELDAI